MVLARQLSIVKRLSMITGFASLATLALLIVAILFNQGLLSRNVFEKQVKVLNHGELTLLTVSQSNGKFVGGTALLLLDIKPGKGMVYIDTYPLAKIDTVESVRFANEIACKLSSIDCSNYDFFYKIKAGSAVVSGPSAGAGIAALTLALLQGFQTDKSVAVTGTITSGGVIGPVSGIVEKCLAAEKAGLKTVLIPSIALVNISNQTVSKLENLTVNVVPVTTLDQVFKFLTHKQLQSIASLESFGKEGSIRKPSFYNEIMKGIALDICEDANLVFKQLSTLSGVNSTELFANTNNESFDKAFVNEWFLKNNTYELLNTSLQLYNNALKALNNSEFYSAASMCYGFNVKAKSLIYYYLLNNSLTSVQELNVKGLRLKQLINNFGSRLNSQRLDTLLNVQTFLVVRERLEESAKRLNEFFKLVNDSFQNNQPLQKFNETNNSIIENSSSLEALQQDFQSMIAYKLALAEERYNTAVYWYRFFSANHSGIAFHKNQHVLKSLAFKKILKAEERVQYLGLLLPSINDEALDLLQSAKTLFENNHYLLALFKSAKAEARVNMVLSTIGVKQDQLQALIDAKLKAAKRLILQQKDFPFLGYSYYSYAKFLRHTDPYSALLYCEYALELSDLSMFFQKQGLNFSKPLTVWFIFALTFATGLCLGLFLAFNVLLRVLKPSKGVKTVSLKTRQTRRESSKSRRFRKPWRGSRRASPGKKR